MPWFVSSIARIIGMTAESARNKEMHDFVKSVLDPKIHAYAYPSSRLILMFKNWSKMSKFVRSADDNDKLVLDEDNIFIKSQMGPVLSLLNGKDGSKAEKHGKENVASAGSGGKSIQSGGSGGISALSCTSIHADCLDCGMRRHVRDNGPALTFEESCVTRFAGCGMTRQWGGKHSCFGFEESGARGHGVLGLGVMTKWGGKHRSICIPEQSGATESGVLGGMMRQLGCGMMRVSLYNTCCTK